MCCLKFKSFYILVGLLLFELCSNLQAENITQWNEAELIQLRMNWLGSLSALPPDPSNNYADDLNAAKFGHKLFFDTRFSKNGEIACASCHIPEKSFTDGLTQATGIGKTLRNTPSVLGIAYSPWFFWDGRSDSLWSQALSPLESSVEHGGNRMQYAYIIYNDPDYQKEYQELFGSLPDLSDINRFPASTTTDNQTGLPSQWNNISESDQHAITQIFVNISKALAAYQRQLIPSASRFDQYVSTTLKGGTSDELTKDEIAGLKLFIGKAMCINCHQGPLFTNHAFHNVGAPDPANKRSFIPLLDLFKDKPLYDVGRYEGVKQALKNEFNCLGQYSDATENDCAELKFANTKHTSTLGAFKVPTLRNITLTAPYFQLGQFQNLSEVLKHYNEAPTAPVGHSELTPLGLNNKELGQIEAFLHSLNSMPSITSEWLSNPY